MNNKQKKALCATTATFLGVLTIGKVLAGASIVTVGTGAAIAYLGYKLLGDNENQNKD